MFNSFEFETQYSELFDYCSPKDFQSVLVYMDVLNNELRKLLEAHEIMFNRDSRYYLPMRRIDPQNKWLCKSSTLILTLFILIDTTLLKTLSRASIPDHDPERYAKHSSQQSFG